VEYCIAETSRGAQQLAGDVLTVRPLFDDANGCEKLAQRLLHFSAGRSRARLDAAADEVLYVLQGTGTGVLDGAPVPLAPGTGVFVAAGTSWSVEAAGSLDLLSVLVDDPVPAAAPCGVVDLAREVRRDATAARQFVLGVTLEAGCASATQFIGFIPPGRAPDHFHLYDEVLYVLAGEGSLHIGGDVASLGPGSCVHLPARLVHSLENAGSDELRVLGVFRPAGSPAEAYYPDGTPAPVPEEA